MPAARVLVLCLAGAALLSGCDSSEEQAPLPTRAGPQHAKLGWEERFPESGPGLVFRASTFTVTADGWEARIAVENRTAIAWRLVDPEIATQFGAMLFPTADLGEVEERSREGDLPGLRAANRLEPAPPARLAPGATWRGTMSALGPLAAGLYVRLVYGPLVAVGDPPEGLQPGFSWITDHSYRLKE